MNVAGCKRSINACKMSVVWALSASALGIIACSDSRRDSSLVERDSAGVRVITWMDRYPGRSITVNGGDIEIVGGSEEAPILNVRCMQWFDDTTAVFADGGDELHIVNVVRRSTVQIGRRGAGPGEFRGIVWCRRLTDGRVGVFDSSLGRLTTVSVDGAFASVMTPSLEGAETVPSFMSAAAGTLVGVGLPPRRSVSERHGGVYWGSVPIVVFRASNAPVVIDTVVVSKCREDRRDRCSPDPDALSGVVTAYDSVIVVSPLDWPELREMSVDGRVSTIFRGEERTVGFNKMFVDGDRQIWFGYERSGMWEVLGRDRLTIVEVVVPETFRLFNVIGWRGIGVVRDSLGVQRIGVVAIE